MVRAGRGLFGIFGEIWGFAWDALLLVGMPLLYLVASYLTLDLPARWLLGREPFTLLGGAEFLGSLVVGLVGLGRVLSQAPPLQPVSPQFARRALLASWITALLLTVGDLAG